MTYVGARTIFCNCSTNTFCIDGEKLAKEFSCGFIETSAKSRINVDHAFYNIVREIRRYNKEMSSYSPRNGIGGAMGTQMDGEKPPGGGCCGGKCVMM